MRKFKIETRNGYYVLTQDKTTQGDHEWIMKCYEYDSDTNLPYDTLEGAIVILNELQNDYSIDFLTCNINQYLVIKDILRNSIIKEKARLPGVEFTSNSVLRDWINYKASLRLAKYMHKTDPHYMFKV